MRKKNSFGTREISFHKCRYLLIFAVITQLFSPPAHSVEAVAPDTGLTIHLIASKTIKKYIIFGKEILNRKIIITSEGIVLENTWYKNT